MKKIHIESLVLEAEKRFPYKIVISEENQDIELNAGIINAVQILNNVAASEKSDITFEVIYEKHHLNYFIYLENDINTESAYELIGHSFGKKLIDSDLPNMHSHTKLMGSCIPLGPGRITLKLNSRT